MGYPIYHSAYTAAQIEAAIGKGPRVNASGYWEVWNVSTMAYESTGVGAGVTPPTVVTQVSQMTNHGYIYIYNGTETGYTAGYWYYWNGSAWTAGGAYQVAATDPTLSVAGAAADAKACGELLNTVANVKRAITLTDFQIITCVVTSSNTLLRSGSKYHSAQVARDALWDAVEVTTNPNYGTQVTFVKEALPVIPTSGVDMSSSLCVGETGRYVITTSQTVKFSIPSDCAYIVITTESNSKDCTPSVTNVLTKIGDDVVDIQSDLLVKQKLIDQIESTISGKFTGFIQKNISSSTGKLSNTGAEYVITQSNPIPIKSVCSAKSSFKSIRPYFYAADGSYLGVYSETFSYIGVEEIETLRAAYPTAVSMRLRFGDDNNPVTVDDYTTKGVELILFDGFDDLLGSITLDTIARYGDEGVFSPSGDSALEFTVTVPYTGDDRNQIFICVAKYEQDEGIALRPSVKFMTGTGLNGTSTYDIGGNGHFEIKQWRVLRYPGDKTPVTINFSIPVGVTCTILDFHNEYSNEFSRTPYGIRINSHRRFPMTPQDTLPGVEMAAKAGATAMIEIPKRLSDGRWIFYHDDSLTYNDTYIRQADGTELPSTYDRTLWNTIDFDIANSWDWGVSTSDLFAGTKPMTMEQFFTYCGKTGIMPMLSIHPWPSSDELGEIKAIARKCGVLNMLGIKASVSHIAEAYAVFGNDIESYTADVSSGSQSASVVNAAISAMDGLTGCTVRRVIELFASTAYNAYFGGTTYDAFKLISDAGYGCALATQTGAYHPTLPNTSGVMMKPSDFDYWQNKGVTEYTYEYNWSFGLNW